MQLQSTGAQLRTHTASDAVDAPTEAYDVIVVGAGWSGLMACKYCVAEGLRTVVLESRDRIGGVWAYTDYRRYCGGTTTTQPPSFPCVSRLFATPPAARQSS